MSQSFKRLLLASLLALVFLTGCEKEEVVTKSTEKALLSFKLTDFDPVIMGQIDEANATVTATVPYGSKLENLALALTHSQKSTATPATGSILNFSNPVSLTITAEDGSKKGYTATIQVAKNDENAMVAFAFPEAGTTAQSAIDVVTNKITVTLPYTTDVTKLVPQITVSEGATVSPASGVAQNFTNPVTYTVTAQNGVKKQYTVTVTKDKSPENNLLSFAFNTLNPPVAALANSTEKTVTAHVPFGTAVTSLVPTIQVSSGATVVPASGTAQDFTNPVTYKVTAQNGDVQLYTVAVVVAQNDQKVISAFAFNALSPSVTATINENVSTITATVPYGTNVSALVPTINFSEASVVSPASGQPQDFTQPVSYTVTAQNGSRTYLVTVTVETPAPVISSVLNNIAYKGEEVVISGNHFSQTLANNTVKITRSGVATTLVVNSVVLVNAATNTYELRAQVPTTLTKDKYTLQITVGGKTGTYGSKIDVVGRAEFYIFKTDKTSYARGETITVTGQNLQNSSYITNIELLPVSGGVTHVYSVVVSADGTTATYTLSNTISLGNYELSLVLNNYNRSIYSNMLLIKIE